MTQPHDPHHHDPHGLDPTAASPGETPTPSAGEPAMGEIDLRIEDSLRRMFEPPRGGALIPPAPMPIHRRPVSWRAVAALASVMALAGLGWLALRPGELDGMYKRQIAAGFVPEEVCTDAPRFAKWMNDRFGAPVAPPDDAAGVAYVGWSSARMTSLYTGVLLARKNDTEIIVLIDFTQSVRENDPRLAPGRGLKQFRRQIGQLTLIEISPLDQPSVVNTLELRPELLPEGVSMLSPARDGCTSRSGSSVRG